MAIPSVLVMACSHRGCLDIHLAGIDDLVLVAGRALDRLALGLVDPAQLDLELLLPNEPTSTVSVWVS